MRSSVSIDPVQRTPDKLPEDSSSVGQRPVLRVLPVVFLGVVGLVVLSLLVTPPDVQPQIGVLSQLVSTLFCLGCTFWMTVRAPRGRQRWGWSMLSLALLLYATGDVVIIILVANNVAPDQISLADVFFLPLSPLLAIGAILFPPMRSTSAKQVRVILDVCIVVGAVFGLALVFLIAPRVTSGTLVDFIFVAYPVTDLILLLTLIVLLIRGVQSAYRSVLFWLMIGMLCLVYADTMFNYFSLPFHVGPSYVPGTFYIDPFWVAAALSFSLAPLSLLLKHQERPQRAWFESLAARLKPLQPSGLLNQLLLLLVPALLLFGLLAFAALVPGEQQSILPLIVLTLLVMVLIIVRQLLTQSDLVDARIANERAEQLDALKDQFITSVNHELRTPLMTMQGYLELLGDPEAQATLEKRGDMLERARGACANLVHLVRSILDTRRIEQEAENSTPEVVSLRAAVETALTLIDPREANPTGRRISLQIPEGLEVWGNASNVQQILTNLFSNAIKYSAPDTPIHVTASLVTGRSRHLLNANRSDGQPMVEVAVQDQGLGIPPEQRDLLFRRFVRLPREIAGNIHGNGLGLHLCRVFAEAMGGIIWVESTGVPGEGSTFHLRLPAPVTEEVPAPLALAPSQSRE